MECCNSPPSIGTWKIYVRTPVYFPPRVQYSWSDNTGTHKIEGNSYLITESYPDNTACDVTIRTYQTNQGNPFNVSNSVWRSKCPAYLYFQDLGDYVYLYLVGGTGQAQRWDFVGSFNIVSYGMGAEIVSQVPVNLNTPKTYRLQIFNNGESVYDESKTTQPTAQQLPEGCLQTDQKVYVRDYENWKSKDYCQQVTQGNQTTLLVMSEQINGGFAPLSLAYQSSDERCSLAPIFDIECNACRTCPEGSCEVICGDHVCCYNSEGISIDNFPIEELCP